MKRKSSQGSSGAAPWCMAALLLGSLATPPLHAQVGPRAEAVRAWGAFRIDAGEGWRVRWNDRTGYARFVSGGSLETSQRPANEQEWNALARTIVRNRAGMFGLTGSQLELRGVHRLRLAHGKMAAELAQSFRGVPVHRGSVVVVFLPDGRATSIDAQVVPVTSDFRTDPVLLASEAAQAAAADFERRFGTLPDGLSTPSLEIYGQVVGNRWTRPRLAWFLEAGANSTSEDETPERWRYAIAADTAQAEVLARWNLVHSLNIEGSVLSWSTPHLGPDTPANPQTLQPLELLDVTAGGLGTTQTSSTGHFLFPNALSATTVSAVVLGPYCQVENLAGANSQVSDSLTPGVPKDLIFNSSLAEFTTAEGNAYSWVLKTRDYLKAVDPALTWLDFPVLSEVNATNSCNAFFLGDRIHFRRAGGGCPNMAYSTVVVHELGHWLNVIAGSGNGPDGFGEGAADSWAIYVTDQPIVGKDFFGPGTVLRTGENLRQFCGDLNPGCYGEPHDDGEVLMGVLWKARRNLETVVPQGGLAANQLFVGWFNAFDQGEIQSVIEDQWLALDDDDGNLTNGTPDFAPIDAAFRTQGFPGREGLATCYVSTLSSGVEVGTMSFPFTAVADCLGPVLSGGDVAIAGGAYPAPVTISKAVTLRAQLAGSTVTLGSN